MSDPAEKVTMRNGLFSGAQNWRTGIAILFAALGLGAVPRLFVHVVDLSARGDYGNPFTTPWLSIESGFNTGVGAAIGLALTAIPCALSWKRNRFYTIMALWQAVLWNSGHIVRAGVIQLNVQNLFEPLQATSSWRTYEDYASNWWIGSGALLFPVFASMILSVVFLWLYARQTNKEQPLPVA